MMQPLAWTPDLTLVLASASPQRRAILGELGVAHVVRPTAVAEDDEGDPPQVAKENARRKAVAGRDALGDAERARSVVLACDTVVALDGRVYGKPSDAQQAVAHLRDLSGRTHEVLGALAIATPDGGLLEQTEVTGVTFKVLTGPQVDAYVETGEWSGRAGGYAIQGCGADLVEQVEGDYLNVVGLPVAALASLVQGLVPPFTQPVVLRSASR